MPNYSNGKIYTIRFHNTQDIYIGSTVQSLAVRFGGHKSGNSKPLKYIIDTEHNGDWSCCYYELYENYNCNNVEELRKKEGEVIRKFMNDNNFNCLNKLIAGRSNKETKKAYREKNQEYFKQYRKQYYLENKNEINENCKKYYNNNLDYNKKRKKLIEKTIEKNISIMIKKDITLIKNIFKIIIKVKKKNIYKKQLAVVDVK